MITTLHDSNLPRHIGHVVFGSGVEPVLVLHDWHADHSNYDPVLPYLDGTAFRYLFADLRGYGLSAAVEGEYSLSEAVNDCIQLMDREACPTFHVVGHSMSGMNAQRLLASHTARIKSAVFVCPTSAAGMQIDDATREFFASTTTDDERFCRLLRYMSGGLSVRWEEYKLRQSRRCVRPDCRTAYLRMMVEAEFVQDVWGIETPVLVIIGANDRGIDRAAMQHSFLTWHQNAQLAEISDCGHHPMQECPPRFATLMEEFLRRHVD